jgi:acyl dehydratase
MDERTYPYPLSPLHLPLDPAMVERIVTTIGPAKASQELYARGIVPPASLTHLTLILLTGQPRRSEPKPRGEERPSAVAGGVWVREQVTYHRPLQLADEVDITGGVARRFTRKGRRFSTTLSETRDPQGRLLVSSCTTGMTQYRPDPSLADETEGLEESAIPVPGPDAACAAENPCRDELRRVEVGERIEGAPFDFTLELLQRRDGKRPGNPIHSDPEAARKAGLSAPIAGGSHVLALLQETLMDAWGAEALIHGAAFDVRFISPVRAGSRIVPRTTVTATGAQLELDLEVECDGQTALAGRAVIPVEPAA